MKLSPINSLSFNARIIDSHVHTGHWDNPSGASYLIKDVFEATNSILPQGDTVEKVIVSNLDCAKAGENGLPLLDELKGNRNLLNEIKDVKEAFPLAFCDPKNGNVQNIETLFKENEGKFIGLKFHPDSHKIMASDSAFDSYLKFAQNEKIPCLFHCGINRKPNSPEFVDSALRFSSPDEVYKAAKKIPDTPVIMAHMGAGGRRVHEDALDAMLESIENGDAKLYADISWVDINTPDGKKPNLIRAIKRLRNTSKGDMTDRLLFGTDAPIAEFSKNDKTYSNFVQEIKDAIKSDKELANDADEIIDKIFYKNAQEVFFDKKWAQPTKKGISKTKIAAIVAGSVVAIGLITALIVKYCKNGKVAKKA